MRACTVLITMYVQHLPIAFNYLHMYDFNSQRSTQELHSAYAGLLECIPANPNPTNCAM